MRIKNPNPPAPVAAANGTGALLSLSTAQLRAGVEIDGEHYAYKYDLSLADMMRFQEAVAGADDDQAVASKAVDEAMKYCVDLPDEVRALLPPTYRAADRGRLVRAHGGGGRG